MWIRCALSALCASVSTASAQEPEWTFDLTVHVAAVQGRPVVDDAWLQERIEWVNTIFAAAGVAFREGERTTLAQVHAVLETREDRDALAAYADVGIHCFVVASLRDVDDTSRLRQGVHWHARTMRGRRYVIVTAYSGPTTLAHELGHYFGNRAHSTTRGNIMSYDRGDSPPVFDAAQIRNIRRAARRRR